MCGGVIPAQDWDEGGECGVGMGGGVGETDMEIGFDLSRGSLGGVFQLSDRRVGDCGVVTAGERVGVE